MRITARTLVAISIACALLAGGPAAGAPKMKSLGADPTGDGPPSLDITYLEVGRDGDALRIHIGVAGMVPPGGGIPDLPGIEWIFDVRGRTFIAEAVATTGEPAFYLFEVTDRGFTQLGNLTGTYDSADGFIAILVPLDLIAAKKGTSISGASLEEGAPDVDAHVHAGPQTAYADTMMSKGKYVVP